MPQYYVWKKNQWIKRKKSNKPVIARIFYVSPKDTERLYFRLLLLHLREAISHIDVKTYYGYEFATFKDCGLARGLLSAD